MFGKKENYHFTEDLSVNIGKNIAALRKQKGLTQEELANLLGVSAQAVSKWENENSCPDISLLTKIADVFGITVDELIRSSKTEIVQTGLEAKSIEKIKAISKKNIIINVEQKSGKTNRIKVPMRLVKLGLKIGNSFGLDETVSVKINEIIENEDFGEIVTVDSENGEHITISVE